ncbi:MAG: Mannosylglycerate hydrolase, partial [Actinomycetota bacterium]
LQWCLPVAIHSHEAVCGTQFGHVRRARHGNTSWDIARFEVCAHRFVAVAEPRFGVAVLADGPRGWDVRNGAVQLTLLRSPRFPDPEADRGLQKLAWSVRTVDGPLDTARLEEEAESLAHPVRIVAGSPSLPSSPLVWEVPGALVSALKPADDGSGDVIVRAWETTGGRTHGTFSLAGFAAAVPCDALEDPVGPPLAAADGRFAVSLGAFAIATWRLSR